MSNTDKTYANRYNILRGRLIYNFHLQNPTKQLEGPSTPASIITTMNNSKVSGSCCFTSIPDNPAPPTSTILVYITDQGSNFDWSGVTYTLDTDLPNFSYTAIITSIPGAQVPSPANLIGVTIGNSVTNIGSDAFRSCAVLTSIIIPDSVLTIGNRAFQGCTSLTSVTIGNSVTSIGEDAFYDCGFTSIIIPNLVTSIGDGAFFSCLSLTTVTIGNSVGSIGEEVFKNCSALSSVTIPNSVTSIGDNAFNSCTGLISITIPNSVTSIGADAFASSGLTTVTIANGQLGISSPTANPPGVAFFGVTVATILPP